MKIPKNAAWHSIEHDTAKDDRLPPGEDMYDPATDRGKVVPFATQLSMAISRQPSPDWDSCGPGK